MMAAYKTMVAETTALFAPPQPTARVAMEPPEQRGVQSSSPTAEAASVRILSRKVLLRQPWEALTCSLTTGFALETVGN